jgi:hypothetical protein
LAVAVGFELALALATAERLEAVEGTAELGAEETLPLPETVKETVLLRADRLSSAGRHSVEIAATAGLRFDLELLAALGGADGIDEAIERGFLVEVVEHTGSVEPHTRALSLEGKSRRSSAIPSVELAHEGLALALAENLTEAAAKACYRLASALKHVSSHPEALDAYSAATTFCHQQGISGMAEISSRAWRR